MKPGHHSELALLPQRPVLRICSGSREKLSSESGSSLIEYALTALLLFTVLFGIMDCSRAIYIDLFLANVAREATRYASVRGSSWPYNCSSATSVSCTASSANIAAATQSMASAGITSSSINVTSSWPGTDAAGGSCSTTNSVNAIGCVIKVTVTYPFTFVSPLLPHATYTLTSTAESTIVQ